MQSTEAHPDFTFEALQKTYSQRLFRQIIAITRHHEDAEDALQDTLYKAFVALPKFEGRCHIYTWLSRIAINCALMKIRKRSNLREFSMDSQDSVNGEAPVAELSDPGWSPEDLYSAKERSRKIKSAIRSLDPVSQRILALRTEHEYSVTEIASALDASVSAVKARMYRARHTLRSRTE